MKITSLFIIGLGLLANTAFAGMPPVFNIKVQNNYLYALNPSTIFPNINYYYKPAPKRIPDNGQGSFIYYPYGAPSYYSGAYVIYDLQDPVNKGKACKFEFSWAGNDKGCYANPVSINSAPCYVKNVTSGPGSCDITFLVGKP